MTEGKYNTKDIKHINEKNQEYIAEGNRMAEENNKRCNNILGKFKTQEEIDMAYQQLARLEQDGKQLTQWLDEARRNADFWCDKCTSLEQERDELKKQNAILLGQLVINDDEDVTVQISQSQFDEYNELKQENKELKEKVEVLDKMTGIFSARLCDSYRSALEEINILAKNYCNACDEFKAKTYKNKNDCLYCNYGFIKRKINEVLQ